MKHAPLRAHFVAHLHRRRMARHFLRLASLELFRHVPVSNVVPPDLAATLNATAREDPAALLARLQREQGGRA